MSRSVFALIMLVLFTGAPVAWSQTTMDNVEMKLAQTPRGEVVEYGIYCWGVGLVTVPGGVDSRTVPIRPLPGMVLLHMHTDWKQRLEKGAMGLAAGSADLLALVENSCQGEAGYLGNWMNVSDRLAEGAKKMGLSVTDVALFDPSKQRNPKLRERMMVEGDAALYSWVEAHATYNVEKNYRKRFGPVCSVKLAYVPSMQTACSPKWIPQP